MPQEDPYAKYAVGPVSADPSATANPSAPTQGDDPYAKYAVTPVSTPTSPTPPDNPDPYAKYAIGGDSASKTQPTDIPSDPNAPWYKQAWDAVNRPISESVFGLPEYREGAGGFERGAEKILSGFTSPLSLALTIGTLGTGSFIESAGASVLKEAGRSAAEIAAIGRGSEAAVAAMKAGQPIEMAVKSAGVDPALWKAGQDILYKAGLKEADLTAGSLIDRGAASLFRKAGLTPAASQTAAKTMQGLVNAGFTFDQLHTAAEMSPRVLDALKEGDYDHAAEYATEAIASGGLGILGASHALHTAGELFEPASTKKLRPSDETVRFKQAFDVRGGAHEAANQSARLLEEESMKDLGFSKPTDSLKNALTMTEGAEAKQNLRLAQIYHGITLGFDKDAAAQHFNTIAEAAGREERLPTGEAEGPRPENGQAVTSSHPALPDNLSELIANSDLKSKPAEYIDRLLDTYKGVYEGFTDSEMKVAQNLRNKLSEGLERANQNGLMGEGVKDYMTRVWKEQNPGANRVIADANAGRFNTSVSQARHRVFSNELEPLLKGYEYATENPVQLTAKWMASVDKAIANRNLLDSLRDNFVRASDGRPATVLSGSGRGVEGTNGENPATMINPNRVRDIKIDDKVISHLEGTGELQRRLDEGTIVDMTPKIRPDNLNQWIDRLETQSISKPITYDAAGNVEIRKKIQTLKDVRDGKLPASALEAINADTKPVYVWRPNDYITINNPAFRGWNYAVSDPSGNPVLTEADIKVHPEFADYLKTRLGLDESGLQTWGPTKYLLKGSTKVKKTLLSLSPFHMMQEGLRAVMTGISPFMKAAPTIENSPVLRKMVDNHLTLEPDYHATQEHSEGVSGHINALSKIPGIGRTLANSMDWYEDFLFKRYIPNLKARAAEVLFDQYEKAHPEWSKDKIAQVASAHLNDTFGGQNWRAMGRSAATQDWARLMLLAPDWLESELRSGARLFNKDEGSVGRAQIAKMTMGLWGVARVLNLLTTGKPHLEAPFGLAMKGDDGKETVYSMRTLPVDLLHAASDPTEFMKGRLNPIVRAGQEAYSGRDQFGRKMAPGDMWMDIFHNMSPIPLQSVGKMVNGTSPDLSNVDQLVKAAGGTAVVYKTEAQKLAAELASNHTEDGPVDSASLHRHQAIIKIEDQIRSGKATLQQILPLRASGQLSEADYKRIVNNYQKTRGMTADQASLYTRAARAPASELLQIYDAATNEEKTTLLPLVKSAGSKYIKRSFKDMTPNERMTDPTLARYMRFEAKQATQVTP